MEGTILHFDARAAAPAGGLGVRRRSYRPPSLQPFRQLGQLASAAAVAAAVDDEDDDRLVGGGGAAVGAQLADGRPGGRCQCCTPNIRVLSVAATLFGLITAVRLSLPLHCPSLTFHCLFTALP